MEELKGIILVLFSLAIIFLSIYLCVDLCSFMYDELTRKEPVPENITINNLADGLSQIEIDNKYICFVYKSSISCLNLEAK